MLMRYKKFLLLILMFVSIHPIAAQDSLRQILERNEITGEEWYDRWLKAGNYNLQPVMWVKHTDSITRQEFFSAKLNQKKELVFYIPDTFQVVEKNGTNYIQAYLYNFTDTIVNLLRYDGALCYVDYYFMLDKNWIKEKPTVIGVCGNGFWTQQLPPRHYLYFLIENDNLVKGNKQVGLKLALNINKDIKIESRKINVQLFENQVRKLTQLQ